MKLLVAALPALLAVPAIAQPIVIQLQRQPQAELPPPAPSPVPVAPPQVEASPAPSAPAGRRGDAEPPAAGRQGR